MDLMFCKLKTTKHESPFQDLKAQKYESDFCKLKRLKT
eukprot:UN06718